MKKSLIIIVLLVFGNNIYSCERVEELIFQTDQIDTFLKTYKQICRIQNMTGTITVDHIKALAARLWHNECGGKYENLTFWNAKEEFPSMGIGHFIWFPQHVSLSFTHQRFPLLLQFLEKKYKKKIDDVLRFDKEICPWDKREAFYEDFHKERMETLRAFLKDTIDLQLCFIVKEFSYAVRQKGKGLAGDDHEQFCTQFQRLMQLPTGLSIVMDYTSFKGIGGPQEEYGNYGWGLSDVLQEMEGSDADTAIQDFVQAAELVLKRRIENAPQERQEEKFWPGWKKRLATYLE